MQNYARPLFLLIINLAFFYQAYTQKATFFGFVRDSLTGESLSNASIYFLGSEQGVSSNSYGYFAIMLQPTLNKLIVSYVGYQPKLLEISGEKNHQQDVLLVPLPQDNSVTVVGKRRDGNVQSTQMGRVDLSMERIKQIPALLGEVDVLKALQLLPGVRNAGEGNAGFYVRGGGPDQNLILLDDAVVYNTGHLFGFFSVFNGDAVKNLSLIKGGMPANYGGRLSSVIDITMKDGSSQDYKAMGGIGNISSRISIEGPLKKDRSSFIVAARRTYIDVLVKPLLSKSDFAGSGYFFYDLNTKLNFKIGDRDRLFISGYFGRDVFNFKNEERNFSTRIPWGNSTATLRWNHIFNQRLFANTTLVYNDYQFYFDGAQNDFRVKVSSGIRDQNGKIDFDFFPNLRHKLKFGAQYIYHQFLPNQFSGSQGSTVFNDPSLRKKYAWEYAAYVHHDWDIQDQIKLGLGLRASGFTQIGPFSRLEKDANGNILSSVNYSRGQPVKSYGGIEPRWSARFGLRKTNSIKLNITRNLQYIHLASNSSSTLPTDLWVPSTYRVRPQDSWQFAAGYFQNFKNNTWETSVELYYKKMDHQIEYREGYTPSLKDPEEDFVFGKGWSYGAEFFANKIKGRLTGWIGYTLSYTWRRFPQINNGQKYPSKYDRRHDGSVVANYLLNQKWKFGGVFVYGTGNAATFPERFYVVEGVLTQQFSQINAYRMPAYHRIDLSATYTPKPKKLRRLKGEWVFSIYNVYSRLNPYFIYFDQEGSPAAGTQTIKALKVSIFPIIPSVTWNFKW